MGVTEGVGLWRAAHKKSSLSLACSAERKASFHAPGPLRSGLCWEAQGGDAAADTALGEPGCFPGHRQGQVGRQQSLPPSKAAARSWLCIPQVQEVPAGPNGTACARAAQG